MKKLLTIVTSVYITLLVSGCGGGSSGASNISESRYYVIVRDMPAGKCEGSSFRNHARDLGAINIFTEEHNDTITCASYGGSRQCVETVDDTDTNGQMYCLVGFDGIYDNNYYDGWGDDWWLDDGWDDSWGDDWWYDDGWDDGWGDSWGDDGW